MAVHASFGRWNTGNGGSFDARMTVAAIDAVIAHVMLVAELQGLPAGNVLSRHIGRARHREHGYERHSDQKEGRKHTEPRDEIGTAMKNLRSEEHTSELQSQSNLVCRLLLEKKKKQTH